MLLTRALSALVLAPIVIAATMLGGWALVVFLGVALGVASREYVGLLERGGAHPSWGVAVVWIVMLLLDPMLPEAHLASLAISVILIGSLTWQMTRRSATAAADWALANAGGLYLGWAGQHFIRIRFLDATGAWLILTLAAVWLADTGAYLVGTRWGRHKMTPTLSPKKSWEGLIGGMLTAIALSALLASALNLPPIHGAALGLIGALAGTLGDLSISMMKRQVGAKDSGHLIPGHGGALDRLDSLLFVAIVGYLYLIGFAGLRPA